MFRFVDVIHTSKAEGTHLPLGHVDFWPNGGTSKNVCGQFFNFKCEHRFSIQIFVESLKNDACKFRSVKCDSYGLYKAFDSLEILLKSIQFKSHSSLKIDILKMTSFIKEHFESEKCTCSTNTCTSLGYYIDTSVRGNFYLTTNAHSPFCID